MSIICDILKGDFNMKLVKENKYNKWNILGVNVLLSIGLLFGGCTESDAIEVIPTPEPTAKIEITSKPEPTVKIELEPTVEPVPELSYEEEIKLLGIKDPDAIKPIAGIFIFEYTINENKKIMFTYMLMNKNLNGEYEIYNWFTQDMVFTFHDEIINKQINEFDLTKMTPAMAGLNSANIDQIYFIDNLSNRLKILGSEFDPYEYFKVEDIDVYEYLSKISLTNLELADFYLWAIPKQYRVSADELKYGMAPEDTPKVK